MLNSAIFDRYLTAAIYFGSYRLSSLLERLCAEFLLMGLW